MPLFDVWHTIVLIFRLQIGQKLGAWITYVAVDYQHKLCEVRGMGFGGYAHADCHEKVKILSLCLILLEF